MNRFRFRQHPGVIPGLNELRREFPAQMSYIDDMILYAEVGRDRRKLGLDWVDRVRVSCEKFEDLLRRTE